MMGRCGTDKGFTLLEVLLACVLASVLGVLVSTLLKSALDETRAANQASIPVAAGWMLRERIATDIDNARAYSLGPNSLTLGGFLSIDPHTGVPTQHLAIVTYQIVLRGERLLLERIQQEPSSDGLIEDRQVVWDGANRMQVAPRGEILTGDAVIMPELVNLGMQPLIDGLMFQLRDDRDRIVVEIW